LGDTVMCLPAVAAGRELFPEARTYGLVTEKTKEVLSATDLIDEFIVADGSPFSLRSALTGRAARTRRLLARIRIDLAVIFLGDDYAGLLTDLAIPHRVFVEESALGCLATNTYSIGHPRTWGPAERLGAWRALRLNPSLTWPRLRVAEEARVSLARKLGSPAGPFVVVHPFGRTSDQWWPLAHVHRLAELLMEEGVGTLVVGGTAMPAANSRTTRYRNLSGDLSLSETMALMQSASAVVSTDSGPFHIAGALGTPGVGLFRAARSEHARRYPTMRGLVAPAVPECAICAWDGCAFSPCKQMHGISPAVVFELLMKVVTGEAGRL
jgi:ADP-heptose:LPS heptosyltransferase